jgi:1,4-dihydroxy-2-naphthoyl-CoA hydrolase
MLPPMSARDRDHFASIEAALTAAGREMLPGHMGIEIVEIAEGRAKMRCRLERHHLAPNGYMHAGSVISLADTAAGYGCVGNFPDGASGFTTIELKTNFLATLIEGVMVAEAQMVHGGRTTQIWDVEVRDESTARILALFRCTQLLLYPRP